MTEATTAAAPLRGGRAVAFTLYQGLAALFAVAVLVEVFLAGFGVFGAESVAAASSELDPHRVLGRVLTEIVPLVLLLLVAVARPGRRLIPMTAVLVVLGIAQAVLGGAGSGSAVLGGLHAVLAFVYLGLAGRLVAVARDSGAR